MQINLIAVGKRMPEWVNTGYYEYAKRLPADYCLHLIEITSEKRTKSRSKIQILDLEAEKLLNVITKPGPVIALDRQGQSLHTEQLATILQQWHDLNHHAHILIGGPEGLGTACLKRAQAIWSLSALTLPHPLVRIIIAEQIYRAWSIISRHPYHRSD